MNIITLNNKNLCKEHICCAIADKKGEYQVISKKIWLRERFKDGLVFKKGDVRGKVFIEYIPAENAWCPIIAKDYMFINCLWVSGKYKGQGISSELLQECIEDSKNKGKKGLVILTSSKKMPYLADSKYLKYKGFILGDTAKPYFQLMYLPFEDAVQVPKFKPCAKQGQCNEKGLILYYSNQCPFTAKYVPIIKNIAEEKGIDFTIKRYKSKEESQNAASPFTTYSLFYNGKFITHEILSEKNFEKILTKELQL